MTEFPERVTPPWGNCRLLVYLDGELTDDEYFSTLVLVRKMVQVDLDPSFINLFKHIPTKKGEYNMWRLHDKEVFLVSCFEPTISIS